MVMTEAQKEARSELMRERAVKGLGADADALIEYYRKLDPSYAKNLEEIIGLSAKKNLEQLAV